MNINFVQKYTRINEFVWDGALFQFVFQSFVGLMKFKMSRKYKYVYICILTLKQIKMYKHTGLS